MSPEEFYKVTCRSCEKSFYVPSNTQQPVGILCEEGNVMIKDGILNILDKTYLCPKYTEHKKDILNKKLKKCRAYTKNIK